MESDKGLCWSHRKIVNCGGATKIFVKLQDADHFIIIYIIFHYFYLYCIILELNFINCENPITHALLTIYWSYDLG